MYTGEVVQFYFKHWSPVEESGKIIHSEAQEIIWCVIHVCAEET